MLHRPHATQQQCRHARAYERGACSAARARGETHGTSEEQAILNIPAGTRVMRNTQTYALQVSVRVLHAGCKQTRSEQANETRRARIPADTVLRTRQNAVFPGISPEQMQCGVAGPDYALQNNMFSLLLQLRHLWLMRFVSCSHQKTIQKQHPLRHKPYCIAQAHQQNRQHITAPAP